MYMLAVDLVGSATGVLQLPQRPYKNLMLLAAASRSHRNVFMPLVNALADRGHKIVILSGFPPTSIHPNVTEENHELPHMKEGSKNMFEIRKSQSGGLGLFQIMLPAIARDMYKVPSVKKLYEKKERI